MPLASARQTLRFMHTDQLAASWAGPFFLLGSDELPHAGFLYVVEIFDHTHAVLRSVSLIQVFQRVAGKAVTVEAVLRLAAGYPLACLDLADHAGLRLGRIILPAARASVPLSHKGPAQPAVHPARSNQFRRNRIRLCRSLHFCLSMLCGGSVHL